MYLWCTHGARTHNLAIVGWDSHYYATNPHQWLVSTPCYRWSTDWNKSFPRHSFFRQVHTSNAQPALEVETESLGISVADSPEWSAGQGPNDRPTSAINSEKSQSYTVDQFTYQEVSSKFIMTYIYMVTIFHIVINAYNALHHTATCPIAWEHVYYYTSNEGTLPTLSHDVHCKIAFHWTCSEILELKNWWLGLWAKKLLHLMRDSLIILMVELAIPSSLVITSN